MNANDAEIARLNQVIVDAHGDIARAVGRIKVVEGHKAGRKVEILLNEWERDNNPTWLPQCKYRLAPEPRRWWVVMRNNEAYSGILSHENATRFAADYQQASTDGIYTVVPVIEDLSRE